MVTSYDNVVITFLTCLSGTFALQVENNGEEIQNSPLAFSVEPGTSAHWQQFRYFLDHQLVSIGFLFLTIVLNEYPGDISIHSSVGYWKDGINTSKPGEELKLTVLLRDAFGNILDPSANNPIFLSFNPSTKNSLGNRTEILRYRIENDDDASGYVVLIFVPKQTGKQWLEVGNQSAYLFNSPFSFFVDDGMLTSLLVFQKHWCV